MVMASSVLYNFARKSIVLDSASIAISAMVSSGCKTYRTYSVPEQDDTPLAILMDHPISPLLLQTHALLPPQNRSIAIHMETQVPVGGNGRARE
jgi:hypothetical protein